jgi:hypothetical protein
LMTVHVFYVMVVCDIQTNNTKTMNFISFLLI